MRDLVGTGAKVAVATLASVIAGILAGKFISVRFGIAAVGLFGLLRQLLQTLALLASVNGQTPLVQGIASLPTPAEQRRYAANVFLVFVGSTGVLVVGLGAVGPWLAPWLIPHADSLMLLRWLGMALIATVTQAWSIGVLSGNRDVNGLVGSQLVAPVAVLAALLPMEALVRAGNQSGLILVLAAPAVAISGAAIWRARAAGYLPRRGEWKYHRTDAVRFFRMASVVLLAMVISTGAQYAQGLAVATRLGFTESGYYFAAWTISMSYVTLVLGSLGTYYMPSLSRLGTQSGRQLLIRSYLQLSLLAMPVLVSAAVVLKPWALRIVYSEEALPALKVMRWMLLGDLFKGVSWVLAFPMLAFRQLQWFFFTEVIFSGGVLLSAIIWLHYGGGIEGLGFLFMAMYALYLPAMALYAWRSHGIIWTRGDAARLAAGVTLVGGLSYLTWRQTTVAPRDAIAFIVGSGGFVAFFLRGARWPERTSNDGAAKEDR